MLCQSSREKYGSGSTTLVIDNQGFIEYGWTFGCIAGPLQQLSIFFWEPVAVFWKIGLEAAAGARAVLKKVRLHNTD